MFWGLLLFLAVFYMVKCLAEAREEARPYLTYQEKCMKEGITLYERDRLNALDRCKDMEWQEERRTNEAVRTAALEKWKEGNA